MLPQNRYSTDKLCFSDQLYIYVPIYHHTMQQLNTISMEYKFKLRLEYNNNNNKTNVWNGIQLWLYRLYFLFSSLSIYSYIFYTMYIFLLILIFLHFFFTIHFVVIVIYSLLSRIQFQFQSLIWMHPYTYNTQTSKQRTAKATVYTNAALMISQ